MAASTTCSIFRTAVDRVFRNWTVLKMAVENGMGGPQALEKVSWLIEVVEQFFKDNENLYPDEVEYFIGEILNTEFDTLIQDDSLKNLSETLCRLYRLFDSGSITELQKEISVMPDTTTNEWKCNSVNDEMDSEEEETEQNSSSLNHQTERIQLNTTDEEGWTTVTRKR